MFSRGSIVEAGRDVVAGQHHLPRRLDIERLVGVPDRVRAETEKEDGDRGDQKGDGGFFHRNGGNGDEVGSALMRTESVQARKCRWLAASGRVPSRAPSPFPPFLWKKPPSPSVSEVPPAGEHHRQAVLVGGRDHFGVAHRAARLDDGRRAGGGDRVEAVAKRKERVGRGDRAAQPVAAPSSPPSAPHRRGSSARRRPPA